MEIIADPITVNCRKVLAGLKLIGADYTLTKVDYFKGEQKSPEIVAINPNAAIPVLRDGDLVLWESNAILQYAADQVGNASAYPTDLKTRADVNRWLLWGLCCKPDVGVSQIRTTTVLSSCFCVGQTVL